MTGSSFRNFMPLAIEAAREAMAADEVPVGAVLVDVAGRVIGRAGNRTRRDGDPTAHAEMVAIRQAAAELGNERLDGCALWVTLEPCAMCAGAISHARIARLYYAAPDPKGGAVEHGARLFGQPTLHHRPEVYGGICEQEAGALLRDFFAGRR
jgi:tRNA(adenine34) deaminase